MVGVGVGGNIGVGWQRARCVLRSSSAFSPRTHSWPVARAGPPRISSSHLVSSCDTRPYLARRVRARKLWCWSSSLV